MMSIASTLEMLLRGWRRLRSKALHKTRLSGLCMLTRKLGSERVRCDVNTNTLVLQAISCIVELPFAFPSQLLVLKCTNIFLVDIGGSERAIGVLRNNTTSRLGHRRCFAKAVPRPYSALPPNLAESSSRRLHLRA